MLLSWIRCKHIIFDLGEKCSHPSFLCSKDFPQQELTRKYNPNTPWWQIYDFCYFQETHLTHKPFSQVMEGGPTHEKVKEDWYITLSFTLTFLRAFLQAKLSLLIAGIQSWSDLASVVG